MWKDRGMGIVSLVSYKSPAGFMMRMGGYVVTGKVSHLIAQYQEN